MVDVQPYLIDRLEAGHRMPVLVWRLANPMLAISSGPLGGGIGVRSWVVNATVPMSYFRDDPDNHLAEIAAALDLPGTGVGLMTGVDVAQRVLRTDAGRGGRRHRRSRVARMGRRARWRPAAGAVKSVQARHDQYGGTPPRAPVRSRSGQRGRDRGRGESAGAVGDRSRGDRHGQRRHVCPLRARRSGRTLRRAAVDCGGPGSPDRCTRPSATVAPPGSTAARHGRTTSEKRPPRPDGGDAVVAGST